LIPGCSVGHFNVTAGTLGYFFVYKNMPVILSNNHVLANVDKARPSDTIVQPGIYDGGHLMDRVGQFIETKKLRRFGFNFVDAAIASVERKFELEIPVIGIPVGVSKPELGMEIEKVGRTTGYSSGIIEDIHAIVRISYGLDGELSFANQCISSIPSAGGDSGSVMVDKKSKNIVGLLFAGSEISTIFTEIQRVMNALNISYQKK
jgi:hypothetical protein